MRFFWHAVGQEENTRQKRKNSHSGFDYKFGRNSKPKVKKLFLCFFISIIILFFLFNGYKLGIPDIHYCVCSATDQEWKEADSGNESDYRRYWDDMHIAAEERP